MLGFFAFASTSSSLVASIGGSGNRVSVLAWRTPRSGPGTRIHLKLEIHFFGGGLLRDWKLKLGFEIFLARQIQIRGFRVRQARENSTLPLTPSPWQVCVCCCDCAEDLIVAIANNFSSRVPTKVVIREALTSLDADHLWKLSHAKLRSCRSSLLWGSALPSVPGTRESAIFHRLYS